MVTSEVAIISPECNIILVEAPQLTLQGTRKHIPTLGRKIIFKVCLLMGYGDRWQEGKNPQVVQIDEFHFEKSLSCFARRSNHMTLPYYRGLFVLACFIIRCFHCKLPNFQPPFFFVEALPLTCRT